MGIVPSYDQYDQLCHFHVSHVQKNCFQREFFLKNQTSDFVEIGSFQGTHESGHSSFTLDSR